jgi:hypothetical protein
MAQFHIGTVFVNDIKVLMHQGLIFSLTTRYRVTIISVQLNRPALRGPENVTRTQSIDRDGTQGGDERARKAGAANQLCVWQHETGERRYHLGHRKKGCGNLEVPLST